MVLKIATQTDYFLETPFGIVKICTGPNGLSHVSFKDCSQERIQEDLFFRSTFVDWLYTFKKLDAGERWASLSPKGTEFQKTVWRALLEIPFGSRVSYGAIAKDIHRPKACRAVGAAVGANPIALLIPCHRVVPACGGVGNYRWSSDRKQALLKLENACTADLTKLFEAV